MRALRYTGKHYISLSLTGLIDGQRTDMGIDLRNVERRHREVAVGKGQKDGAVDARVALDRTDVGLDRVSGVAGDVLQRGVGDVELGHPGGEPRVPG